MVTPASAFLSSWITREDAVCSSYLSVVWILFSTSSSPLLPLPLKMVVSPASIEPAACCRLPLAQEHVLDVRHLAGRQLAQPLANDQEPTSSTSPTCLRSEVVCGLRLGQFDRLAFVAAGEDQVPLDQQVAEVRDQHIAEERIPLLQSFHGVYGTFSRPCQARCPRWSVSTVRRGGRQTFHRVSRQDGRTCDGIGSAVLGAQDVEEVLRERSRKLLYCSRFLPSSSKTF